MTQDDHNKLLEQLKVDEGFKLYVYDDSLGYATIGYGRMVDRRKGGGITLGEANFLLDNDVYKVVQQLAEYPWYSNQDSVRQAALADMGFNLGVEGLVRDWPKFTGFMLAKDYPNAVWELSATPWHVEVGPRADRIMHLIATGVWP